MDSDENAGHIGGQADLALAALDVESEVDEVSFESGLEELRRRLEVLLGANPEANLDAVKLQRERDEAERSAKKQRMEAAGGQLLAGAVAFLSELVPAGPESETSRQMAESLKQGLADCVQRDDQGQTKLTFTLSDASILEKLAESLSRLLSR